MHSLLLTHWTAMPTVALTLDLPNGLDDGLLNLAELLLVGVLLVADFRIGFRGTAITV